MALDFEDERRVRLLEERLERAERLIDQLQPDLPRFSRSDALGMLEPMMAGSPAAQSLLFRGVASRYINPGGERTDKGFDGEENVYVSGSTLVEQVYDASADAWRSHTLT